MKKLAAVSLVALSLSACMGDTRGERALTGGAIGAGAGALGGAALGYDPLTGAVIGGAAGAAVGAMSGGNRDSRMRDRDDDGVPDAYDRAPRNPYRD
ncbi:MAG: YMGG-like glycine zipper-containing protein [Rhodospirillaceae bacterium]